VLNEPEPPAETNLKPVGVDEIVVRAGIFQKPVYAGVAGFIFEK
jgi:hypothetical protein